MGDVVRIDEDVQDVIKREGGELRFTLLILCGLTLVLVLLELGHLVVAIRGL